MQRSPTSRTSRAERRAAGRVSSHEPAFPSVSLRLEAEVQPQPQLALLAELIQGNQDLLMRQIQQQQQHQQQQQQHQQQLQLQQQEQQNLLHELHSQQCQQQEIVSQSLIGILQGVQKLQERPQEFPIRPVLSPGRRTSLPSVPVPARRTSIHSIPDQSRSDAIYGGGEIPPVAKNFPPAHVSRQTQVSSFPQCHDVPSRDISEVVEPPVASSQPSVDIQSEFLAFLKSRGTVNVLSPQAQISFGLNQVSVPAASIVELPSKQSNLKPGSYDGSSAWSLYERQFNMISKVNGWNPSQKAANLTASLSGPALVVLGSLSDSDSENFDSICAALKLRFGEEHLSKLYFTQFENRRQGPKEDLASLGNDIERLARHSLTDVQKKLEIR
ncbi:mediator of RNA polymerase II transcription subunit 15-like [Neodiprion lecontei]|uniref:Mediator of RNA polymerase II transcription subunit 15-like n=1 Tax=Neodiprion lecontei TaxID=441921 RepID=A0ABM3GFV4_NEOLC|nr:mediator of RNA polymerase II transcription subunit 15-like [Neodiprion lecontei]